MLFNCQSESATHTTQRDADAKRQHPTMQYPLIYLDSVRYLPNEINSGVRLKVSAENLISFISTIVAKLSKYTDYPRLGKVPAPPARYSHSMVAGGLEEMS